ncbi:class I SAM-dependent methyltransferase [Luteimonas suaedae]|uniref:class I SAM-dependent methyltransferase n=1 Tax=Luteimonas suaedae TaxID=2605430 RepID=UPI0011EFE235|nr:class I SAM-dependent methyltransferase [Luteimonas suaedae]
MPEDTVRKPHAVLDLPSRQWKARKVERLLGLDARSGPLRLLEVGTGSGGISHYFGTHPEGGFEVEAVDVVDSRLVYEGYRFTQVTGTRLPFADDAFDIVLSNHVIEHVGDDAEQAEHLAELRRVMRPNGAGYLAVPNRWMLVEPHYRLAFLSWWPERWRSAWLRLWGRGALYDCRPLSRRDLERRLSAAGFRFEQVHYEALRATFEIERPQALIWRLLLRHVPERMHVLMGGIYPTLIYRLWVLPLAVEAGDAKLPALWDAR